MTQIRLRQDTATNWSSSLSITPALGEPCIQTDGEKYFKIGDGINKFDNLPYFVRSTELGDLDDLTTENKDTFVGAINEIVDNGGNKDLSNLTTTGENKLQAVKAYASNGELLTDSEGLADVTSYAHSTFCGYQASGGTDQEKFTTSSGWSGGVITENGILSNCSLDDYVTVPVTVSDSTVVRIKGAIDIPSSLSSSIEPFGFSPYFFYFRIMVSSSGISLYAYDGSTTGTTNSIPISDYLGKKIYLDFSVSNAKRELKVSLDRVNWVSATPNTTQLAWSTTGTTTKSLYIGRSHNAYYTDKIDLKEFELYVDGVEVFSGNKTGIDTIKADDYTVVGTPTISADGIASGFSDSNYLTKALGYVPSTATIKIKMRLNLPGEPSSQEILFTAANQVNGAFYTRIRIFQLNNQWIFQLYAYDGSTSGNCSIYNWTSLLGKTVDIYTEISNTYRKITITDGESLYSQDSNVVLNWGNNSNWQIEIGRYSSSFFKGTIDLNSFKIYVDGDLVYQPCLKIPYTQSKTGSKIVQSIYRDRVTDMYEQFGYAPYYTLSDSDFTLPMGEIYGNIQQTLRSSTVSGINQNYLYSDRMQIQTGSCTSGVEVTLPKPFTDSNYALTVPYSAKSATAFTPTATGDWIAIGLGNL